MFVVLAAALLALPWGIGQVQATYYANSPIIPKFADTLPAIPVATPTAPPLGVPADGDYYEINAVHRGGRNPSPFLLRFSGLQPYHQMANLLARLLDMPARPVVILPSSRPTRLKTK